MPAAVSKSRWPASSMRARVGPSIASVMSRIGAGRHRPVVLKRSCVPVVDEIDARIDVAIGYPREVRGVGLPRILRAAEVEVAPAPEWIGGFHPH